MTAAMRSNLLSLQNIAGQQNIVQNRLATGLKVSSAIDNPSSYYTASSLSNRAADLTALLDAMSQGIQTIKTASEAIDSGIKFLEQAKAVASQTLESTAPIVARVSNEEELLAAVASGQQGFIVLKNDITLTETLELKDGQKLVGDNYFAASPGKNRTISFEFTGHNGDGIRVGNNGMVANLNISYTSDHNDTSKEYGAIHVSGSQNVVIENINIELNSTGLPYLFGIYTNDSALTELRGNINVSGNTARTGGIANFGKAVLNIRAVVNIHSQYFGLKTGDGSSNQPNAETNVLAGSTLNIRGSRAIIVYANSKLNIDHVKINAVGTNGALGVSENSFLSIKDSELNLKATSESESSLFVNDSHAEISSSVLNISSAKYGVYLSDSSAYELSPQLTIDGASRLNIKPAGQYKAFYLSKSVSAENMYLAIQKNAVINVNASSAGSYKYCFTADYILNGNSQAYTSFNDFPPEYADEEAGEDLPAADPELPDIAAETAKDFTAVDTSRDTAQYNEILNQYDMLINDSFYKGINLLEGQNLKVNFNEDRSSKIDVAGVKADSNSLGIVTEVWETSEDVEQSVSELEAAINTLRGYASAFGNYYSIVTTRQDFTENLINVLEEGSDKLTLADMNQEAANMLALQTSQQLAVNSLSLASQASQAVLRLF